MLSDGSIYIFRVRQIYPVELASARYHAIPILLAAFCLLEYRTYITNRRLLVNLGLEVLKNVMVDHVDSCFVYFPLSDIRYGQIHVIFTFLL